MYAVRAFGFVTATHNFPRDLRDIPHNNCPAHMKNNPRAVLLGWTGLAGCALGGYLFAKFYTGSKLRKFSDEGGFGSSTASSAEKEPGQRSVNRRL